MHILKAHEPAPTSCSISACPCLASATECSLCAKNSAAKRVLYKLLEKGIPVRAKAITVADAVDEIYRVYQNSGLGGAR